MDWWPTTMPCGVVGIVSTTPDSLTYASLRSRDPAPHEVEVQGLEVDERRVVVSARLNEYRKKLTPQQMDMLLSKGHAGSPLYLLTSCEELRLQAQYVVSPHGRAECVWERSTMLTNRPLLGLLPCATAGTAFKARAWRR